MSGVPYTFASATSSIPLSELDTNFATPVTIGTTSVALGNTVTTLANVALANVTISSVASGIPNNFLANSSVTIGNTSVALGNTVTSLGNVTLTNVTIQGGISNVSTNSIVNGTSNVAIASANGAITMVTNGNTAVTIDTNQNVGVGVTPSYKLDVNGTIHSSVSSGNNLLLDKTAGAAITFNVNGNNGAFLSTQASGGLTVYTANGSGGSLAQVALFDNSGNLGIGTGTNYAAVNLYVGTATNGGTSQGGFSFSGGGTATFDTGHASGTASGATYQRYIYNGSVIGSITQSGTTAVLYNTTSDYRLKSNVQPVTSGLSVINQLNPVNFTWISDNETDTGFLAHEFQAIIPRSVTGEKDATKTEEYEITPAVKDENGNVTTPAVMGTRTVPVYQQMDNSGAVPYLVAAIKELSAEVTALKAKIGV